METTRAFSASYPLSILIADTHPEAQAATKTLLGELGYEPELAATTIDVLRMTNAHRFDVILMDIRMPGLDTILNTKNPHSGTRPIFIAMAGTAKPDFRETILQSKMDHRITRPMNQKELVLQLQACSVLTGKRKIRQ